MTGTAKSATLKSQLSNLKCPFPTAALTNGPALSKSVAMNALLDSLKYQADGLIPAIIQDAATGQVLVLFWMNRAALEKTIETGKVHSYSRSRGRLALKGESSGHFQIVKGISTDCDKDVVLIKVEQIGAACHEGYYSCFFRDYADGAADWKINAKRLFDPEQVYSKKPH